MSQLLLELLQLKADHSLIALLEHLGNLNQLDKSLLRGLRATVHRLDHIVPGQYGLDKRKTGGLISTNIGRGSQIISDEPITTVAQALAKLADPLRMAMVVKVNEDQVLMIAVTGEQRTMIASEKLYDTVSKQKYLALLDPGSKLTARYEKVVVSGITETKSKITALLKLIDVEAKKQDKVVSYMYVTLDAERKKKHAERTANRHTIVPTPSSNRGVKIPGRYDRFTSEYAAHIETLKADLKNRLNKFKGQKADKVDSLDDMLQKFIKEGYLDKIKFMGEVYNYDREYIRFDDMRKGGLSGVHDEWKRSYISYRRETSFTNRDSTYYELYRELKAKAKERIAAGEDEAKVDAELEAQLNGERAKLPPQSLKIYLVLEGGRVVPAEIKPGG